EVAALLATQDRAAVPAGVVKCLEPAVFVLQKNYFLRPDRCYPPVARRGELLLARHGDPLPVPERLELALVVRGIEIPGCRHAGLETVERFPFHLPRIIYLPKGVRNALRAAHLPLPAGPPAGNGRCA